MRSKLSSKSLAKTALKLFPLIFLLSACNSSVAPSFSRNDITKAVQDICKKEYKIDAVATLTGATLWVYLPLENIVSKPEKPEKYIERFLLEDARNSLNEKVLRVNYLIRPTTETEKLQEVVLDKSINQKIFNVLQVIRRVFFSMGSSHEDVPKFFCIVTADIKKGVELLQLFYFLDLKKLSYGFISQTEYQHRVIQDSAESAAIIGDKTGSNLNYRDITLEEFLAEQIRIRIKLKFQKPEVEAGVDIDKEVLKIVNYTFEAYQYKDFNFVEMNNLLTGKKVILNQASILANAKE